MLSFAGERSDLAWQLEEKLGAKLRENGLEPLFRDLELPLVPVLARIERYGVRIDLRALASQSQRIDADLAARSARVFELAGEEFNINSPKQLGILFEKLDCRPPNARARHAWVAGGRCSRGVALTNECRSSSRMAREIKLKGTYIDALPRWCTRGRLAPTRSIRRAGHGRLSSSDRTSEHPDSNGPDGNPPAFIATRIRADFRRSHRSTAGARAPGRTMSD